MVEGAKTAIDLTLWVDEFVYHFQSIPKNSSLMDEAFDIQKPSTLTHIHRIDPIYKHNRFKNHINQAT